MTELRRATVADAVAMQRIAESAYSPYVARMGGLRPGPLDTDYAAAVSDTEAWVAEIGGKVIGFLLLVDEGDALLLENVAVLPSHHGRGVGHALLSLAERARGQRRPCADPALHPRDDGREPAALRTDRLRRDAPRRRARVHPRLLREAALTPRTLRRSCEWFL